MSENRNRHVEGTTTDIDPDSELFDWEAFRVNGLLWALNRYVLHPRGLAAGWFYEVDATSHEPSGWMILRSDDGLWNFSEDLDHEGKASFDAFLAYIAERA